MTKRSILDVAAVLDPPLLLEIIALTASLITTFVTVDKGKIFWINSTEAKNHCISYISKSHGKTITTNCRSQFLASSIRHHPMNFAELLMKKVCTFKEEISES